jgi:hypothetical protein
MRSRKAQLGVALGVLWLAGLPGSVSASWELACASADNSNRPPFETVQQRVRASLEEDREYRPFDILAQSQVAEIFSHLRESGWPVPDEAAVLERVLSDEHTLVRTMRTAAGRRFLSKVSGRDLIYDRLDRVAGVSGGPELLRDLVKLPDGERYARPRPGGGIPDLRDLLPKNASGKTRTIPHYDEPTGKIYTAADLLEELRKQYDEESATLR